MKFNQKGFSFIEKLFVIVVLIALTSAGFYMLNGGGKTSESKDEIASVGNMENDPYKGWQVYTNKEQDFKVKYPADWIFNEKGSLNRLGDSTFGSNQFVSKSDYDSDNNAYSISIESGLIDTDPKVYIDNMAASSNSEIDKLDETNINGYLAFTLTSKNPYSGEPTIFTTYIFDKARMVQFNYHSNMYADTYKAIINSVEFN